MRTISIVTSSHTYPIYIGRDLIEQGRLWQGSLSSKKMLIVTQKSVADHHLPQLMNTLKDFDCDVYHVPIGEQYKTMTEWQRILDHLLQKKYSRDSVLIAFGGGMVGDMTGFVAACFQRGVPYIQIPTTLMAQVDSAIGGKCGVNHVLGKNMIGVFYHPQCVVADVNLLTSLSERDYISGLAEVVKYGLICDRKFFEWLEKNSHPMRMRDPDVLIQAIHQSVEIKTKFVSQDEKDTGIRQLLNFGHTFGHALENILSYQSILHGEAVAIGMVMAAFLSCQRYGLPEEDLFRIISLLKTFGLLTKVNAFSRLNDKLYDSMGHDKKNRLGKLRLILLRALGETFIVEEVTREEIETAHLFFAEEVMASN